MIKILFICLGNICRSPMAEFVLRDMAEKEGIADQLLIDSAGTSAEEYGNPVYPPARRMLARHGIACDGKYARRMTADDYETFDMLIGMEERNLVGMRRFVKGDPGGKISLLMSWAGEGREVADPWYTRDFDAALNDIEAGCRAMLNEVIRGQL